MYRKLGLPSILRWKEYEITEKERRIRIPHFYYNIENN